MTSSSPFLEQCFRFIHDQFVRDLWIDLFKLPVDDLLHCNGDVVFKKVRNSYFTVDCAPVYDFVECVAADRFTREGFVRAASANLEREMSGYRFSHRKLLPITDTEALEAIQKASALEGPLTPISTHIDSAISLFADRPNPDYRNSIKESISAVWRQREKSLLARRKPHLAKPSKSWRTKASSFTAH